MSTNGVERRGHVLMLAGDRAARRRRPQLLPSQNLHALIEAAPRALLGTTDPTDMVSVEGARDPHLVRARLQTAAAATGDLLVYLTARLTADSKTHALHVALPGTTGPLTRYTALPWDWLRTALRDRSPGSTTVVVDLVADDPAHQILRTGEAARLAAGLTLVGVIAPPTAPAVTGPSPYTQHLAARLRLGEGPLAHLHPQVLADAHVQLPAGTFVLPQGPQQAPLMRPPTPTSAQPRPGPEPLPTVPTAPPMPPPPPVSPAPASVPSPRPAQGTSPRPPAPAAPEPPQADPRPEILQAAQSGRHDEAAQMAALCEQQVLQRYGPDSPQATQWAEIRADLARMAERWHFATQLWIAAARTRLAHQAADAPEVLSAAKSAHYCWTQIQDPDQARSCGPDLISLLRHLPSLDRRHLSTAQARLEVLHHAPSGR